jgi:hypothetical protein
VDGGPQPPVRRFVGSPEHAALVAEGADPDADKREELLAIMFTKGLEKKMANHALKIMQEPQKKGLLLHSVVGAGGSSLAISATAVRDIHPLVSEGSRIALKISIRGVPSNHIKMQLIYHY